MYITEYHFHCVVFSLLPITHCFAYKMDFVLIERTKKEIEDFSNAHDDISPSMTLRSKRVFVCSEENENMRQRYNIFVEYVVISTSAEIDVHVIP